MLSFIILLKSKIIRNGIRARIFMTLKPLQIFVKMYILAIGTNIAFEICPFRRLEPYYNNSIE